MGRGDEDKAQPQGFLLLLEEWKRHGATPKSNKTFPPSLPGAATPFPAGMTHLKLVWETQTGGKSRDCATLGSQHRLLVSQPAPDLVADVFLPQTTRKARPRHPEIPNSALCQLPGKQTYPRINSCAPRLVFCCFSGGIFSGKERF